MRRLLGIALVALAGCHTMLPPPRDLPYPPQRVFQNSYSFMPPAELGWRELTRGAHQLALGRRGSNPDETLGIQGRGFRLPAWGSSDEFVEVIRKGLQEQAADPRYRVQKHEVGADPTWNTPCARSHFVAQDVGLILEVMTLSCAHPKNRDYAVTLVYSHRYAAGQADAQFAEKAARIFASLEFLEP